MVVKKDAVLRIDAELLDRVRDYTEKTGVPTKRVLEDAVKHWLETVAPARLRVLGHKPDKKG